MFSYNTSTSSSLVTNYLPISHTHTLQVITIYSAIYHHEFLNTLLLCSVQSSAKTRTRTLGVEWRDDGSNPTPGNNRKGKENAGCSKQAEIAEQDGTLGGQSLWAIQWEVYELCEFWPCCNLYNSAFSITWLFNKLNKYVVIQLYPHIELRTS